MVAEAGRAQSERPALHLAPIDGGFVGRERELAALVAAIDTGVRRVWVSGASGLGKTELLAQAAMRCRYQGVPYHWVGPHEALTPSALRAICDELARATGIGGRRVLIIDDFAPLRAIEAWFVERFIPALPPQITVVMADRAAAPAWRGADPHISLAPLEDADARRYLALRGVDDCLATEIIAHAEGIPALLVAAADAQAVTPSPAAFYACHDSDAHRLAIAVLVAARTTPYELLELAFEDPGAARDAFAWLARLSVVDHTPDGLRPHTLFRAACERELSHRTAALWARARTIVRRFADRRIAVAREPQRWVLDRLFVDRGLAAVREHMMLRAADPAHSVAPALPGDHAAIRELAAHVGGAAAVTAARWLDDDRAAFDVLRDARGAIQGYLCSIGLDAGARASHADPVLDACAVHLRSIGWFEPASAPDARALVIRDWTVAGSHQAPSAGAARLIAHMAARLLTTPGVDHAFLVTDRPEPWRRALRALGLEPAILVEPRLDGRGGTVIAADLRTCSVPALLERLGQAAASSDAAPLALPRQAAAGSPHADVLLHAAGSTHADRSLRPAAPPHADLALHPAGPPCVDVLRAGPVVLPTLVTPPAISAMPAATAPLPARARAACAAAPDAARGDGTLRAVGTETLPRLACHGATPPADDANDPKGTLERRIAQLARAAALSPREHEVLQLLLLGRNHAEIGTALRITPRTARFHQHNILEKIGAESRLDIVRLLL